MNSTSAPVANRCCATSATLWLTSPGRLRRLRSYDVTFENVQAGERTSHLFRVANHCNGLVVGTGDLSELALGWCTYGVGDHMSHYSVNASVPKTLIRYLINWVAETGQLGDRVSRVLHDVLETEVSPELVPGADDDGQPSQRTEEVIGPYELHDFFLYYTTRLGYSARQDCLPGLLLPGRTRSLDTVAGRAARTAPRLQLWPKSNNG